MFACTQCLHAQEIQTDQPDQSIGASVMERSGWQLESSLYIHHFDQEGTAVISSSLVRLGLLAKLEGRLMVEQGHRRDLFMTEAAQAASPLALGFKLAMVEEKAIMPAISLAGYVQLPFTNPKSASDIWSPSLTLIAEKKLSHFTLTVNGGVKEAVFEKELEWQASSDLKYEVMKSLTLFGEYFSQFQVHEDPVHNIDGGLLYSIGKRMQVHLAAGTSILHHPANYFVNTGVAFNLDL